MKTLKRLAVAALILWAGSALLYQALLEDHEDHHLLAQGVVTDTFPGSRIAVSLYTEGEYRDEQGSIIWGGTYHLGIHVRSKDTIQGKVQVHGFSIVETATGRLLHHSDQVFETEFQPDNISRGSLAFISGPRMKLPFTDCTFQADMVIQSPWGTANVGLDVPFARERRSYRAVPFLEALMSA